MCRCLVVALCCWNSMAVFGAVQQIFVIDPAAEGEAVYSDSCGEINGTLLSSLHYTYEDGYGIIKYKAGRKKLVTLLVVGDKVLDGLGEIGEYTVDAAKQEHRLVYNINIDSFVKRVVQGEFQFQISADKITVQGKMTISEDDGSSCTTSWQGTLTTPSS